MDSARKNWPDWRLDILSDRTENDASRLGGEVERLRKELADLREEAWKRRLRRTELFGQVAFLLAFAYLIATVVLAVAAPS
jgi:hypothetical protein